MSKLPHDQPDAATLRYLGFAHAAAVDGGMKAWRDAGFDVES